jgi:hypothetical protein
MEFDEKHFLCVYTIFSTSFFIHTLNNAAMTRTAAAICDMRKQLRNINAFDLDRTNA